MKTRLISLFLTFCLLCLSSPVLAAPAENAENITENISITGTGYSSFSFLYDGKLLKSRTSSGSAVLSLESAEKIGYLYLIFDKEYSDYILEDTQTKEQVTIPGGILHQCIDLSRHFEQLPTSVTLRFESGNVTLNELSVYSPGQLPDDVQQWSPPAEGKTDLMLLCTHGDDDQLFFAGLLPLYAAEKNVTVQVAYLTDHRNLTSQRVHEMINGLWAVGCDVYPVFGAFPDFRIDDLNGTYSEYKRLGYSKDDLLGFTVEQLRRFRPQVVVGHDIQGEYGHGMHMVYADCLMKALEISNDETAFPELAETYGIWDVPKAYLHLYEENPIVMDYDQPLSAFDGMTAFEVTQKLGFPCHKSQQYTWFTRWLNGKNEQITKAQEISTYSPCLFGLYRSTVGMDSQKNDFLENITTYAELDRLEQERLEQERLEQERLEQERLEQERLEQERLEQERLEQEQQAQEQPEQGQNEQEPSTFSRILIILIVVLIALFLAFVGLLYVIRLRNIRRRSKRRKKYKKI